MDTNSLLYQNQTPDECIYRQTNNNNIDTQKNQESDNNENLLRTDFQTPGNNKFIIKFNGVQVCLYIYISFFIISIVFFLILILMSLFHLTMIIIFVLPNISFLFFIKYAY